MSTEEGWHTVDDGAKLYTKTWKASDEKARLVFVHGFSDHCNAYYNFFPTLSAKGITVYAFDQRGWGRSVIKSSQKGLTGPTTRVLADITSLIRPLTPSPVPLFLMGHSMGGAEVLTWMSQGPADVKKHIRGYLAETPFIAIHPSTRPLKMTVVLGRLAGKVLPRKQMVQVIDAKFVSRDSAVQKAFAEDRLCHDTGTLEGLAGMLDRAADLENGKVKISEGAGEGGITRLWVGHGTEDKVCSYGAAKEFFDTVTVKDKEFKTYPGWYHKLHAEPGEDSITFANDIAKWILDRSGATGEPNESKSKL
ncbi:alpha/beta-hydrolase [Patellaria atrata CBS 101060]|uniref:Alpha/beta-hydrolase n=1 Tax=Patellaria atrata CBS 101060 TaxID=1346257 RepID=A0A9P4VRX3_9PEZI|nr:alpha/beta-hydrolase [Patellaria atrata CBS 101060]